jgi:hypothetical protein
MPVTAPLDSRVPQPVPPAAPRLFPALTIVAVAAVVIGLPGRVHILPSWIAYAVVAMLLLPMVLRTARPADARIFHLERATTLAGVSIVCVLSVVTLANLIAGILLRSHALTAYNLLASSTALWLTNVLGFSLLYWALDGGGPDLRLAGTGRYPDFAFAQAGAGDAVPPGWLPAYMDYLFTSFTTQTAFGPTDALPLTSRAKAVMMLQSIISLITLVVVASRAIGILQT